MSETADLSGRPDMIGEAILRAAQGSSSANDNCPDGEHIHTSGYLRTIGGLLPIYTVETLPLMERIAIAQHIIENVDGAPFEKAVAFLASLVPDVAPPS